MTKFIGRRGALGALATLALGGLGVAAMAQPFGPGGGWGPGMMGGGWGGPGMMGGGWGMMGGDPSGYLDWLQSQLGITDKQQAAWNDYADTLKGVAGQMQGLRESMFRSMQSDSWDQHFDLMKGMFEARQQVFTMLRDAADKLLAALDPAQRDRAREFLPGTGYGPGWRMGGWSGPPAR